MKQVFCHNNGILVQHAKTMLEQDGIDCVIRNEYAGSAMGELSYTDSWPELWVLDEHNLDRSLALIASLSQNSGNSSGAEWQCPSCREYNADSFDLCWQCQTERDVSAS